MREASFKMCLCEDARRIPMHFLSKQMTLDYQLSTLASKDVLQNDSILHKDVSSHDMSCTGTWHVCLTRDKTQTTSTRHVLECVFK